MHHAFFSCEDLQSIGESLHSYLVAEVKLLQFYLKHLQEKGLCSFDGSFYYSSIDDSVFRNVLNYPTILSLISSGIDVGPSPPL